MIRWLVREWPYAALFSAVFLLAVVPIVGASGLAFTLIYLQLPIYMLHQFEEHDRDRFRIFANQLLAGGRDVFTPLAVFVINSLGVWSVDLLALYLADFEGLAWGLLAIYLPLLNGLSHVAISLRLRRYNPGLWTSLALFLPVGIWSVLIVSKASHASWSMHLAALGVAVFVHVLILVYVKSQLRRVQIK